MPRANGGFGAEPEAADLQHELPVSAGSRHPVERGYTAQNDPKQYSFLIFCNLACGSVGHTTLYGVGRPGRTRALSRFASADLMPAMTGRMLAAFATFRQKVSKSSYVRDTVISRVSPLSRPTAVHN